MFRIVKYAGHTGILAGSFGGAFYVLAGSWPQRAWPAAVLYIAILEGTWFLMEAGDVEKRRFLDLLYGQCFGAVLANLFFLILLWALCPGPAGKTALSFLGLAAAESAAGMGWAALCFRLFMNGSSRKKALLLYGEKDRPGEMSERLSQGNGYFSIEACLPYEQAVQNPDSVLGPYEAVYLGDLPDQDRNRLLKECICREMECCSVVKISDIYIRSARLLRLQDKVLFQYPAEGLTRSQMAAKRVLDVAAALILLAAALPVMAAAAVLIRLEDGGPVLYRQTRYTQGYRAFQMLKLRSMHVDAEKDGARLALKNDARVTRTGRILRNLHFDELPQLFNVLKGEMSMVGPRPERREFIETYSRQIPEFKERMKVKGGLTGYAQIYGKYNTGPEDKIKYDLIYIYNYSLRLDIRLLFLTVRILFQKESTQGVEEGKEKACEARKETHHEEDPTS